MHSGRFAILAGVICWLAVLTVGCRPSAKPGEGDQDSSLSATDASALGDLLTDDSGKFSYRMPAGWSAVKIPGNSFKVAVEPEQSGYRANIQVSREAVPRRFDLFVEESRKSLLKLQSGAMIREDSAFTTSAGLEGRRWIVNVFQNGERLWQAYYLVPGPNDDKLVVTMTARTDQELHLTYVSDICMKTLVVR